MAKKVKKIGPVKQKVIMELQPKTRVCAYCRVSTDSCEQHNSFSVQVAYYKTFIGKRDDWEYVGIFADEARSGTQTPKRDEFLRMIRECENGNIDLILTKSVTRFARNTVDSIEAIRRLKAMGIAVYFEKENINTMDGKGEVLITIMSSLVQEESRNLSTNAKWGFTHRFQNGEVMVNHKRFLGLLCLKSHMR